MSGTGSGGGVPPQRRAQGLVVAPVAQPGRAGAPVAGLGRPLDGGPQRLQLALGGQQVGLVRLVAQHLAAAQVQQLQQPRHHARGCATAPARRSASGTGPWPRSRRWGPCRSCSRPPAGRRSGATSSRSTIAAQGQPRRQRRLDVQLALGGLEPARVLQLEVAAQQPLGAGQELGQRGVRVGAVEQRAELGLGLEQPLPLRAEHGAGPLEGALHRGQVEQPLQDGVHHGASGGRSARRLGQPVDHPEAVEQRAGHEVRRPGRRQRHRGQPQDVGRGHAASVGDPTDRSD